MNHRTYNLVALETTIWFNKYGDHDHNGLIYLLEEHLDVIKYVQNIQEFFGKLEKKDRQAGITLKENEPDPHDSDLWQQMPIYQDLLEDWHSLMDERQSLSSKYTQEWLPIIKRKVRQPHPAIVPLVLRANVGDTLTINLKNEVKRQEGKTARYIGIHLVGPGTDERSDGSHVGNNPNRLLAPGKSGRYTWKCDYEGVFVFHDAGDFRGSEAGTNAHGLFGALIVEPAGATWTDPETGGCLRSGLYADVHQRPKPKLEALQEAGNLAPFPHPENPQSLTREYPDPQASFREFVIFFHDEPHWAAPHRKLEINPCEDYRCDRDHDAAHEHTAGSLMPISYRAEPMISRERQLWKMMREGKIDPNNVVVNEEQHHSSWLFGDPDTPVLKAYLGDPVRIRLVHAGVKETHVFHLHVYEWHAIPFHQESNIIDAITISPQTGHTIVPLYGAGNRQMVPGDVIWHCHLYPHFHHGMWGIFRTFDKLQEGEHEGQYFHAKTGEELTKKEVDAIDGRERNQIVRRLGHYPDLTPITKLVPLPDRQPLPKPTISHPGYPLFISGEVGQKSFTPPWHKRQSEAKAEGWTVDDYDYREPTQLELNAFNQDPRPGELFTTFPYPDRDGFVHQVSRSETVKHDIDVLMTPIEYNSHGWWDPHGHLYALADENPGIETFSEIAHRAFKEAVERVKQERPEIDEKLAEELVHHNGIEIQPERREPLFLRCQKTNVMELTLHNRLERYIPATPFDSAWPKEIDKRIRNEENNQCQACFKFADYRGECGLHVHIVKFDPICADGASTGWNYMSAPRFTKKLVYRWWADEEFGTIFTHDHLFANFRQRHGLFGALLVEPEGATFEIIDGDNSPKPGVAGTKAVIRYKNKNGESKAYREFCLGNGDWVPLFKLKQLGDRSSHSEMGGMARSAGKMLGHFAADYIHGKDRHLHSFFINYGVPIEPPNEQDSHNDNGVFGVNYRCEPLAERSRDRYQGNTYLHDPSEWFNSEPFFTEPEGHGAEEHKFIHGDPDTDVFHTLPGEPVRLRLVQGSHEEQHSFQLHGMRWQRFWKDLSSPLKNQQTIGISEAFSFDLDRNYGVGDHLWKYSSSEDLWLGCWGIIRSHDPNSIEGKNIVPLSPDRAPPPPLQPPALEQCRRFRVIAKGKKIPYSSTLSDPFGLVFHLVGYAEPGQSGWNPVNAPDRQPLVLRCRQGEWVAIELVNQIPAEIDVEPSAPELPHDDAIRKVSNKVSIHTDLLRYDVTHYDGSKVGRNSSSILENPGVLPTDENYQERSYIYYWHADREVGAVLLQDMADFRNHRHHGLIGVLIVEEPDVTPYIVERNFPTAARRAIDVCWYGARATLYHHFTQERTEEIVLLLQDGLRYYLYGNPAIPIGDIPADVGEDRPDTEDQGLKGFNYRSDPTTRERGYAFAPSTPLFKVFPGAKVKLHLVAGCDKPRNHSFTLHGHSWKEWEYLGDKSPQVASTSGITSGSSETYHFTANSIPGDYMYRSGVLKYAVEQGLWGILRVTNKY